MSPVAVFDNHNKIERISVSDLSRGTGWKKKLKDKGKLEILDRNKTIGYIMSPDVMDEIVSYTYTLEDEVEIRDINKIIDERKDLPAYYGEELKSKALEYFNSHYAQEFK